MKPRITMTVITKAVAEHFNLTPAQILVRSQRAGILAPRYIAMGLCRELTQASLPKIGRHFGRNHTTIMDAVEKFTAMAAGGEYAGTIRVIREKIIGVSCAEVYLKVYDALNERECGRSVAKLAEVASTSPDDVLAAINGLKKCGAVWEWEDPPAGCRRYWQISRTQATRLAATEARNSHPEYSNGAAA